MNVPSELYFTESHEWIRVTEEGNLQVGLTNYAQDSIGEALYINFPEVGTLYEIGNCLAGIKTPESVSMIPCPLSGTVSAVNEDVRKNPRLINDDPYETWLVEFADVTEKPEFLSFEEYRQFIEE